MVIDLLTNIFLLSVLSWYMAGISELQLGHRLLRLPAGESFPALLLFVLGACVYPEPGTSGEPGAVATVSRRWRVEGGVGSSAVAVFKARRRVSIETRGKQEWALSGLLVWGWVYSVPGTSL